MDPEERQNPQSYHFYKNQRQYLLNGEVDPDKEREILQKIQSQKLPGLADRIQHLVNDIALLNNQDMLTPEYWKDGWDQVSQIEYPKDFRDPDVWLPETKLFAFSQLGFVLGHLGRTLTINISPKYNPPEFAWGFLLGAIGQPQRDSLNERHQMSKVRTYLEEKAATRYDSADMDPMGWERHRHVENISYEGTSSRLSSGRTLREFDEQAKEEVRRVKYSDEKIQSEFLHFLDNVFDVPNEQFTAILKLSKRIRQSSRQIPEISWRKTPGTAPLKTLHSGNSKMTSEDLASECNSSPRLVSYLMAIFTGEKDGYMWTDHPLALEIEKRRGRKWELTPLGKLVSISLFEENGMKKVQKAMLRKLMNEPADDKYEKLIEEALPHSN